uniref:Three-finger toxin n=1 Tax=Calliophis bivirgatus TaxID=8633 RepID=A0A898IPN2_CALBG|nr:three-finger toxin [Calliophis bivirgatus]QSI83944.1 three-finger toxin [Calliophis bivirgatus]
MKTLLLTLVVVTILCLDLGYTLECYDTPFKWHTMTCPKGQNLCFSYFTWKGILVRGCAATCPVGYSNTHCCDTDRCNEK